MIFTLTFQHSHPQAAAHSQSRPADDMHDLLWNEQNINGFNLFPSSVLQL